MQYNKPLGRNLTGLSFAMEDLLEKIYSLNAEVIRINNIALHLGVSPNDISRIAKGLRDKKLVKFEEYGSISLTDSGKEMGDFLVRRRKAALDLLRFIDKESFMCEDAESIKHYLSRNTVQNIENFLKTNANIL